MCSGSWLPTQFSVSLGGCGYLHATGVREGGQGDQHPGVASGGGGDRQFSKSAEAGIFPSERQLLVVQPTWWPARLA